MARRPSSDVTKSKCLPTLFVAHRLQTPSWCSSLGMSGVTKVYMWKFRQGSMKRTPTCSAVRTPFFPNVAQKRLSRGVMLCTIPAKKRM